jgi:hypothetical protein
MFIAHGEEQLANFFFLSTLAVSTVIAIFIFAKNPRTRAVTFAAVCFALCALLLWLILRPH